MDCDTKPRPFDQGLSDCLADIAATVAQQCDHARMVHRLERSEQILTLALELTNVVVTDVDFQRKSVELAGAQEIFGQDISFGEMASEPFARVDPRDKQRVTEE